MSESNHQDKRGSKEMLSRVECQALRGLAIIGIFLHNYCHWLPGIVRENEYQYFQNNVDSLNHALLTPDIKLPIHLLSFFGHYGVPVFLFLSAYGLVMKYEHKSVRPLASSVKPVSFIRYHFLKLFRMMVTGFVAFIMIDEITPGAFHYQVGGIIAQLGLFNNFFPHPDQVIWPGPYWFFGMLFQLYVIYRLLLYQRSNRWTVMVMALSVFGQFLFDPEGDALNWYRYNFMGSLLPFCCGLLFARKQEQLMSWRNRVGKSQFDWSVLFLSFVFSYVFSLNFFTWTFVPALVCAFSVALVKVLKLDHRNIVNRGLVWMGEISAALFICHPITRKIFIPISRQGNLYTGLFLYIIASIGLAWLWKQLMKKIPKPIH
ncbi:MAG: acyltransferase [Prevotella sp.]|jgi:peptidoglycan/LPS O-acetylase OafA/YrhL|nr:MULTISPECIES: acyltransferase [unclassified Prevotella]MCH3969978.1 acyltransferase [Prevotella sp.]MCH3984677.1 acyltransferase [Prevotella sp.]MCH3991284.1 acyltransferase [Prevotella sp.]MCH4018458.1 acyltransferase [Prevotella sp.]MCH4100445.1 acyltransferase [Prevotella sp.]